MEVRERTHPPDGNSEEELVMRNRRQRRDSSESFDPIDWPDEELDVDDDAFARAIAEGRDERVAA
jgi:hypothetical protein